MDEESKAVIEATAHEAAAPYRKVAETLIGYAFLDALEEKRERKKLQRLKNRASIAKDALLLLEHRKVTAEESDIAPEHAEKIMDAGEETSLPELQQLFARLLAAALDPKRRSFYRQEFADVVKQFEPLDAVVLQALCNSRVGGQQWLQQVRESIQNSDDEIMVAALNLEKLHLLQPQQPGMNFLTAVVSSPRARQLIKCIAD